MDDPERDKFYSPPDQPSDDEELELEPPDESIAERKKQAALDAIRSSIDIDEIYREADRNRGSEILENWARNFRFRFQVKHLLIATAVLAIVLTLIKLKLFWTTLIVSIMLSVASLYAYLKWEERKHEAEAARGAMRSTPAAGHNLQQMRPAKRPMRTQRRTPTFLNRRTKWMRFGKNR